MIFILKATRSRAVGARATRNTRRIWPTGDRISSDGTQPISVGGADRIENILWRLENGELDGVNPKIIVILAGANNVANGPDTDAKAEDITQGIKALVDVCREKAPDATIILTAIFQRNDKMSLIRTINESISHFADGKKIRFLNVNDRLADQNGRPFDGMMNPNDKLHPSIKGYQVWADGLKPIFTELLGPPASSDHAPPPTGDPSALGKAGGASSNH